jgi:hypothetical protein
MKKLKLAFVSILAAFAMLFCVGAAPVTASAETATETPPTTNETQTDEEVIKEDNTVENKPEITLDDILEFAGVMAEEAGLGNKWDKAVENLKMAATTQQVTLSTVASFGLCGLILIYILYKKHADKKFRAQVGELVKNYNTQLAKLNELVDGTNENNKTEAEIKQEEKELKAQMQKTNDALYCLIGGFMHFVDGVAMKDGKKAEVRRDCNKALQKIDGEVIANENNKK